jgi:Cu-Zn family superoxide dismutase
MGNRGDALMIVLTGSFSVEEVIGRTISIHAGPDNFTAEHNNGRDLASIACGVILEGSCTPDNMVFS